MAAANESEERRAQKSYWMEHSKDLSVEAMMLDSRASDLDKEERPEVLSLLPPYQGKYVLELGAGIGRFTGELAKEAGHILALDFIESVIKKNERINGHFQNTSFLCADVTSPELAFEEGSVDLLFSNWLLMYLSDDEYLGYEVKYVRNFTDIDDKIIKRANEKGEDPLSLSKRFSEEFLYDMAELNCLPPTHEPRVSDHIEHIKDMITKILENGHAYTIEGDVYFSVDTYPDYYCLSGRKSDDNRAGGGGRVAVDTRKRNPADFALWKAAKLGEPSWESPWGPGRPGWHIECSAMSAHHLGDCFDIHGGGKDLMFPHHENEIAQSSSACPQSKVNYWMHNGFVNRDNQKMSKSDNNFFTIRDIITIYHPLALRFFLLRTHYRSDVNYSDKALDTASDRVFYMYQTLHECEIALSPIRSENFKGQVPADVKEQIEKFHTEYLSSMSDDLHTTTALDDLIDLLKSINGTLKKFKGKKQQQPLILSLLALKKEVKDFLGALGLLSLSTVAEVLQQLKDKALKRAGFTEEEVQRKIEERNLARKNKEYEKSDLIREELYLKGISLMDEPKGTIWRPCEPPEKKSEENIDTHIDKPIS